VVVVAIFILKSCKECVAFYLRIFYSYLQDNAKERLKIVRQLVGNAGLDKANVLLLKARLAVFSLDGY